MDHAPKHIPIGPSSIQGVGLPQVTRVKRLSCIVSLRGGSLAVSSDVYTWLGELPKGIYDRGPGF